MVEQALHDSSTVLIADDDRSFALHLKEWFETRGHRVQIEEDPALVEQRLVEDPPDLILLDHHLRGANPVGLMRLLRRSTEAAFADVIVVIDGPVDEALIKTLEAGADDFLSRPFTDLDLEAVVTSLIRRSRALRDVSPLTGLPGNHRCTAELRRRIEQNQAVAVAHADLDHFKPFNDHYGFLRGDQVIKFAAHIIQEALAETDSTGAGFVGHIGGDDYVILLAPDDAEAFCRQVIDGFDDGILDFYDPEDALRGYVELKDRKGGRQAFPMVGISLGVATTRIRPFTTHFEATEIATEMKKFAKSTPGSTYEIDRRTA